MSPKKIPYLRVLEGNPGRRPIAPKQTGLVIEAIGSPEAPLHLSYEAHQCFDGIRLSMPPTVYASLDSFLLSAFAMAWATHKTATVEIGLPGFEYVTRDGRANPWLAIANRAAATMLALSSRLGLDPLSRAGLNPPSARRAPSKFEGLVNQTRTDQDLED